jgi:acylphosphatase
MAARHIRVTGRVQGVFFRGWTRDIARRLGVRGWVRNCDDGSVEAHLEGSQDRLEDLTERMRSGPPGARVDELTCDAVQDQHLQGFEVRR